MSYVDYLRINRKAYRTLFFISAIYRLRECLAVLSYYTIFSAMNNVRIKPRYTKLTKQIDHSATLLPSNNKYLNTDKIKNWWRGSALEGDM